MTPEQFVAKWQANTRGERQAAQEHFLDLCALLGEATPNSDPDGSTYAFEKGATKATGGEGWADVWRRGCFAWEYKESIATWRRRTGSCCNMPARSATRRCWWCPTSTASWCAPTGPIPSPSGAKSCWPS